MNFWATSPPEPTTLAGRFGAFIDGVGRKIGAHLAANRHLEPILALVYHYLRRSIPRLERLIARFHAGTLTPRRRPVRTAPERAKADPPKPRSPRLRLPSRRGWLLHLVQPTAQHIGHLELLVASAEMQELIAAAPQAGRILRPLFRMYAQPLPEFLRLPARPRRPRPARPASADRPVTARERRAWRSYSPGPLRNWPGSTVPSRRKIPPA